MELYIVTYPKSGTTWMQNIVANLYDLSFDHISEVIPTIVRPEQAKNSIAFKTHVRCSVLPEDSKKIYVMRNPVDVFLSYQNQFGKNMPLFPWSIHVNDALRSKNCLLIKYESLQENFDESLEKIADFLELSLSEERKAQIKKATSFAAMRQNSNKFTPKSFSHRDDFFRLGESKEYPESFFTGEYKALELHYNKYKGIKV